MHSAQNLHRSADARDRCTGVVVGTFIPVRRQNNEVHSVKIQVKSVRRHCIGIIFSCAIIVGE